MSTNPPNPSPEPNATDGTTDQVTPGAGSTTQLPDTPIPDGHTAVIRGLPSGSGTAYVGYDSSVSASDGIPFEPSDPPLAFPVDNLNRLHVTVPSGGGAGDGIAYAAETDN